MTHSEAANAAWLKVAAERWGESDPPMIPSWFGEGYDLGAASRPALVADSREAVADSIHRSFSLLLEPIEGGYHERKDDVCFAAADALFALGVVTLAGEHAALTDALDAIQAWSDEVVEGWNGDRTKGDGTLDGLIARARAAGFRAAPTTEEPTDG